MPPQTERIMLSADGANPLRWNPQQGVLPLQRLECLGWRSVARTPEAQLTLLFWGARFLSGDTEADRGIGKDNLHKALVPPAEVALSSSSEAARRGTAALY